MVSKPIASIPVSQVQRDPNVTLAKETDLKVADKPVVSKAKVSTIPTPSIVIPSQFLLQLLVLRELQQKIPSVYSIRTRIKVFNASAKGKELMVYESKTIFAMKTEIDFLSDEVNEYAD